MFTKWVLLVSCYCSVAVFADTKTIQESWIQDLLKKMIKQTNERIQSAEVTYKNVTEQMYKHKEACRLMINMLKTSENQTNLEFTKNIKEMKELHANISVTEFEGYFVSLVLSKALNNIEKVELDLKLIRGQIEFLKQRRESNESARCLQVREIKLLRVSNSGSDIILILENELRLARNKLHQLLNRIEEQEEELKTNKKNCGTKIKNLEEELSGLRGDVAKAEAGVKALRQKLTSTQEYVRLQRMKLTQAKRQLEVMEPDFRNVTSALKVYEPDEACYKALAQDVIALYP